MKPLYVYTFLFYCYFANSRVNLVIKKSTDSYLTFRTAKDGNIAKITRGQRITPVNSNRIPIFAPNVHLIHSSSLDFLILVGPGETNYLLLYPDVTKSFTETLRLGQFEHDYGNCIQVMFSEWILEGSALKAHTMCKNIDSKPSMGARKILPTKVYNSNLCKYYHF